MLFSSRFWPGIADGSITLTFRRWKRTQAVAGHVYRTPAGRIAVDSVAVVDPGAVSDGEARKAGFATAAHLLGELRGDLSLPVYRVAFHLVDEPDPREELAARDRLTGTELEALAGTLQRLDAASFSGPWTAVTLRTIAEHPGVRAGDLAAMLGRETMPFKADVRKLKARGLTISLETGYRLSPRGQAFLGWLEAKELLA